MCAAQGCRHDAREQRRKRKALGEQRRKEESPKGKEGLGFKGKERRIILSARKNPERPHAKHSARADPRDERLFFGALDLRQCAVRSLHSMKPETRNPKPETRNPKPETRNPEAKLHSKVKRGTGVDWGLRFRV
jgi:hypothetical protein